MLVLSARKWNSRPPPQSNVLLYEGLGFAAVIAFIWANELLDLPHLILGSPPTKVNLREAVFESASTAILGLMVLGVTRKFLSHIKYLEGLIVVCAFCKKVRVGEDTWVPIEEFVRDRAPVEFSHSLCPSCVQEHYGDFRKDRPHAP